MLIRREQEEMEEEKKIPRDQEPEEMLAIFDSLS